MKFIANFLIIVSASILIYLFYPIASQELRYNFEKLAKVKYVVADEQLNTFEKPLTPPNTDFSILIPKIGAAAPIISDVDSQNKKVYLMALKNGVAHAKGTAYPDEIGNTYLFAHSTDAFYNVSRYNAVFYLIGKLKAGDEIYIYYEGEKIKYLVDSVKVVNPNDTQYLDSSTDNQTLTLQTCYPPGTTLKRLVVVATKENLTAD